MKYVVDASVAIKWVLAEELTAEAVTLITRGNDFCAPDFLWLEIDNVFWKKLNRGQISATDLAEARAGLRRSPIRLSSTLDLLDSALAKACQYRRTVYDCVYLALAEELNIPMVTADQRLVHALAGTPLAGRAVWLGDLPAEAAGPEEG